MAKKLFVVSILFALTLFAKNPVNITFQYDDNHINKVIVAGKVSKVEYLGISLYPKDFKDAIKDGYHLTREILPDSFRQEITFENEEIKKYNSSYEIALWGKKILQKDCLIKDCYWCRTNGFHLDELLFYQTGYFNLTPIKNNKN